MSLSSDSSSDLLKKLLVKYFKFFRTIQFYHPSSQNSSVRLTWDETPQSRLQLTTKKFSAADLETVDFSAYIASSESESEGEEEGKVCSSV